MFSSRPEYNSPEYSHWRNAVYARDAYTCQLCHAKNTQLNAHHVRRWVDFPALRFVVGNGVTLCRNCHDNLVTGNEHHYESQFLAIIAFKKLDKQKKKGKGPKPKWKPRNPGLRF